VLSFTISLLPPPTIKDPSSHQNHRSHNKYKNLIGYYRAYDHRHSGQCGCKRAEQMGHNFSNLGDASNVLIGQIRDSWLNFNHNPVSPCKLKEITASK
jgi:hypothetical protein